MQGNLNPSARIAIAGFIPPQQAAVGTLTSGWVDMRNFYDALGAINVGAFGANATVDVTVEQATAATGAGAKAVAGLAATRLAAGTDNRQVAINVRQEDLDKNNGFRFVRLSVTVGTAPTFVSGMLIGMDARYGTGTANQSGTVAETVS